MIKYYRPKSLEEAIELVSKPHTFPLGGGTVLNRRRNEPISLVDLQLLELRQIHQIGSITEVGATATLQDLVEYVQTHKVLQIAIKHEAPLNLRNMATIGGALIACDGRSPLLTTLLAMDPIVFITPGDKQIHLGDFLPLRLESIKGKIITKIHFSSQIDIRYEYVSRAPMDKPIICVAVGKWPSGRIRMALGGWGKIPIIGYDGKYSNSSGSTNLETAAKNAAHDATDEWASSEYRSSAAATLAKRCVNQSSFNQSKRTTEEY